MYSSPAAVIYPLVVCVRLSCRSLSQTIGLRRRPIVSHLFIFQTHTSQPLPRVRQMGADYFIFYFFFPFIISTGNFSIGGKTAKLRDPKVSDGISKGVGSNKYRIA